ncbi:MULTISPECIES: hypothetical protein [Pasteurellaceae]|uniref:Plasmid replication protein RepL domain-containing protein n=1 Tax=Pasteurella atlantica TaxID=2827233 RepID=A0AAW8CM79_9PAST|nr:hypothetical protein [Pasteurella atlantica]MBR0574161.1 hypothetical protein [Pasteurella atlantica]MDP8039270.1 hypothetical protein [Pasteurella atlantica]MDP8041362.1 hypothetical protein [Pasteurella atlantica]MDP8043498.1 hypothetical protein [Pasteurella atlantica]MDP8045584.1 hypothetical protein [Pasteurella atlantica]
MELKKDEHLIFTLEQFEMIEKLVLQNKGATRILLFFIKQKAKHSVIKLSYSEIAEELFMSYESVRVGVKFLQNNGYLEKQDFRCKKETKKPTFNLLKF